MEYLEIKTASSEKKYTVPLSVPDLGELEEEYLKVCIRDSWVSSAGPYVSEMETRLAKLTERKYAVATISGTSALHLALIAAGVTQGDYVIVPDWTFAATANAVFHAGATPIFVDISEESWTIEPDLIKTTIEKFSDGKITAVIPVYSLGHPAHMDKILAITDSFSIPLVEDVAGAIGATYKGKPAGSLGHSSIFSFNGNKTITTGGGGMVVTNDELAAKRMNHLSLQARSKKNYEHDEVGYNFRMTNLNAAVGLAQLDRFDSILEAKRNIADAYEEVITEIPCLTSMPRTTWGESNYWLYSVLCETCEVANDLINHLSKNKIEARLFWQSLSSQKPYIKSPHFLSGVSASISNKVVSLPSSSSINKEQLNQVIEALKSWKKP